MTPRTIDVVAHQDPASADLSEFRQLFNGENLDGSGEWVFERPYG